MFGPDPAHPLLLFGGPYSNLEALDALLEEARRQRLPMRNLLCTGDVVAYCADPQAVVERMREHAIAVVQGNCEEALGTAAGDCGCGFAAGSACDLLSAQWYRHAQGMLDDDARRWMRELPARIRFDYAGKRWLAIHGGMDRINRFVFASTPKRAQLGDAGEPLDVVVAGHSGIPFVERLGTRLWLNPGVIGMPANDGTPRVWYATARRCEAQIEIRLHALAYDHARAARKMRERGLPAGYARALGSGLWPALDVLPEAERARTGTALAPLELRWH